MFVPYLSFRLRDDGQLPTWEPQESKSGREKVKPGGARQGEEVIFPDLTRRDYGLIGDERFTFVSSRKPERRQGTYIGKIRPGRGKPRSVCDWVNSV